MEGKTAAYSERGRKKTFLNVDFTAIQDPAARRGKKAAERACSAESAKLPTWEKKGRYFPSNNPT